MRQPAQEAVRIDFNSGRPVDGLLAGGLFVLPVVLVTGRVFDEVDEHRRLSGTAGRRLTGRVLRPCLVPAFGDGNAADRHVGRLQVAILGLGRRDSLEQGGPLDGVGRRLSRLQGRAEFAGCDLVTNKFGTVRRRERTVVVRSGWLGSHTNGRDRADLWFRVRGLRDLPRRGSRFGQVHFFRSVCHRRRGDGKRRRSLRGCCRKWACRRWACGRPTRSERAIDGGRR